MQQIMNGNSSGQPKGMSQENEGSEQPPMNPNEAQMMPMGQPGEMMARGGLIEQEFRPVYTSNPNDPRFSNYPGEVLYGMGGPYYEPYNIQYANGGTPNFGVKVSPQDSVRNMAWNTMTWENNAGGAQGNPLSNFGNPSLPAGSTQSNATDWYMNNIFPQVNNNYSTAMEKASAGDFKYNTGRDLRVYAYQEYLKKTDPDNKTNWKDANGKWKDRSNLPADFDSIYAKSVGSMPLNERRIALNNGRDWYYKNTFSDKQGTQGTAGVDYWSKTKTPDSKKKYQYDPSTGYHYEYGPDGTLSPAYGKTWYGRIHASDQYENVDPNQVNNKSSKYYPKRLDDGGMTEMYAMGGMPQMYAMGGPGGSGRITFGSNPVTPAPAAASARKYFTGNRTKDEYLKLHPEVPADSIIEGCGLGQNCSSDEVFYFEVGKPGVPPPNYGRGSSTTTTTDTEIPEEDIENPLNIFGGFKRGRKLKSISDEYLGSDDEEMDSTNTNTDTTEDNIYTGTPSTNTTTTTSTPVDDSGSTPYTFYMGDRVYRTMSPSKANKFSEYLGVQLDDTNNAYTYDQATGKNRTWLTGADGKLYPSQKDYDSGEYKNAFNPTKTFGMTTLKNGGMTNYYSEGGVVDASVMDLVEFKDGGMYINPKNKGKFTAWAKSHGMSVQEAASHVMANKENYSPTTVKRANFAKNASTWKHEKGGIIQPGKTYKRIGKRNSYMFDEGGTTTQDQAFDFIRNQGQKPAIQDQNEDMIMGPDYILDPSQVKYKPAAVPPAYVKGYTTKKVQDWTDDDRKQYTWDFYAGNNPFKKDYIGAGKGRFGDLYYDNPYTNYSDDQYREDVYNTPEVKKAQEEIVKKYGYKSFDDYANKIDYNNPNRQLDDELNMVVKPFENKYYPSIDGVPFSQLTLDTDEGDREYYNLDETRDNTILTNDTKQAYFNYLDSPAYLQTAKKMWGDDYQKHIDEQKMRIQNVPVVYGNDWDFEKDIHIMDGSSPFIGSYDPIAKRVYVQQKEDRVPEVIGHELSHSSDSGYNQPSDLFTSGYSYYNMPTVNPKYQNATKQQFEEWAQMDPAYKKWIDRFPTPPDTATEKEKYFKEPTEIRGRVNALRAQMSKDNFNWNRANQKELMDYLNGIQDPNLKFQFEQLMNPEQTGLDESTLLDLFQNYAANEKKTDTRYAANGGLITQYAEGGVYDLDDQEIERLRKLGYEIEIG
jgi:hypothetical protein